MEKAEEENVQYVQTMPEISEENAEEEQTMIDKERELYKLMLSRRGKLGALTRKRKDINGLLEAGETRDEVEQELSKFLSFMDDFGKLHERVQSLLPEEERGLDHSDWFEPKIVSFSEFIQGIDIWLRADVVEPDDLDPKTNHGAGAGAAVDSVSPYDSVSQAARKPQSKVSSRASKIADALADARVEQARLEAQADSMDRQLELDIEELQIKSKKERHQLQVKMAQNAATIKALSETDQLPATPSGTSTQYIIPTTTKKRQTQVKTPDGEYSLPNVKAIPTQPKLETQSPLAMPQRPQPALRPSLKPTPVPSNDPIVDIMKR